MRAGWSCASTQFDCHLYTGGHLTVRVDERVLAWPWEFPVVPAHTFRLRV